MARPEKSFLKIMDVWKQKHWIIFASEKTKRFWCNLSNQYKVTIRPDANSTTSKTIYIGEELKEAYKVWLDN